MVEESIKNAVTLGIEKYSNKLKKKLEYGTSGFRDKGDVLSHVMYRMGLLAVLRSKTQNGAVIGVMITASHNPEEDNGVKLCDPSAKLLNATWEAYATELANSNDEDVGSCLHKIIKECGINWGTISSVSLGRDTRASSLYLAEAVSSGVEIFGGKLIDHGLLTTPHLHYIVYCQNTNETYGTASTEGYCTKLSTAFLGLHSNDRGDYKSRIFVDAANGVGARALKELAPYISSSLDIRIFNEGTGILNFKCGADYVKIQQSFPNGIKVMPGNRYASLDGDADRLIYFYMNNENKFCILDGDKIAALIAKYLKNLVDSCNLSFQFCVVQTAYANGNSTRYIENVLGIPVVCVPTGVKHLHHEAEKHEIGIYFEANGHGSILFQKEVKLKLKSGINDQSFSEEQRKLCQKLLNVIDLINETVGDAISDMLIVETILSELGWDLAQWNQIYTDIPYRQLKVKVADKSKITTTDAGRICVTPLNLQEAINVAVSKYKNARAFIRPSGTEDIVRVYTEAETQVYADSLAKEIEEILFQFVV